MITQLAHKDSFENRVREAMKKHYDKLSQKTDKLFGLLLLFEWILGVIFAFTISPNTWLGDLSSIHIHVYASIFLGAVNISFPLFLIYKQPGEPLNRMIIAVSQILTSVLFIHLTGGRIETHFHIFGSLAFLAFYRDWRPVMIATLVTATDHFARGAFWPQSVYGTLSATPWRAMEHAGWVLFEDIILLSSIRLALGELRAVAESEVAQEDALLNIEKKVEQRTAELKHSQKTIVEQQKNLMQSAKMASLGLMSAGIAHEINNPLAIISSSVNLLNRVSNQPDKVAVKIESIRKACDRIAKIVVGLKKFSRTEQTSVRSDVPLSSIVKETMLLTENKSKQHGVTVTFECKTDAMISCDEIEIEQVLVNLIHNAIDAIKNCSEKWVMIFLHEEGSHVVLRVVDSGPGIPEKIRAKLFDPFFTTKAVGEGTGLGLSITKGILDEHHATIEINSTMPNTCFEIRFMKIGDSNVA